METIELQVNMLHGKPDMECISHSEEQLKALGIRPYIKMVWPSNLRVVLEVSGNEEADVKVPDGEGSDRPDQPDDQPSESDEPRPEPARKTKARSKKAKRGAAKKAGGASGSKK